MSFCVNCGKELVSGARFCAFCGLKIGMNVVENTSFSQTQQNSQRQQEFVGKIFKCPNCGEVINQSAVRCNTCGYEISGKNANETVKMFSQQLMNLENRRIYEKPRISETIVNAFCNPGLAISQVDAQILSLIRSFPIPNTIEEISEFMFLAIGNINVNLSKNTFFNNCPNGRQQGGVQKEISDAWVAKMQQVYAKAEKTFSNEPEFEQIKNIYNSKMKELKIKNHRRV